MKFSDITNFFSISFFVFWLVSFIIFWISPQRLKQGVLLILSYVFYSSFHLVHIGILLLTTTIDFYFGKIIYKRLNDKKNINLFVGTCIFMNLGMLIIFKYNNFLFPAISDLTYRSILVPLGISFFTLQSIGYILDISRGKLLPEKNIITYALFVSFFPQIIAGPIERASEIIPQYKKKFDFQNIEWGKALYLFGYGFFKKYVVADNIASILESVNISGQTSFHVRYITLIFFFIRIYCDFSGYTNMARSIALLFNIHLKENFNFPLFASSPQDFWDRWHMSLGQWVKNYFYTPLIVFFSSTYLAILLVFPIMGLWHGPNINFLFWGLSWAVVIILYKELNIKKIRLHKYLQIFFMFNLSSLLIVFYKVKNFTGLTDYFSINTGTQSSADSDRLLLSIILLPLFVILYEFFLFRKNDYYFLVKKSFTYQMCFYFILYFGYRYFSGIAYQQVFYLQF